MKLSFGIDLGTTNSAIAVMRGRDTKIPQIIALRDGRRTLPSCVLYDHGKIIVGMEAYKHRWETEHCVYSVKRLMGQDTEICINDGDKEFTVTPAQVSSEILKELKRSAEILYGEVTEVTITVPAYFNVKQREATQEAAKLAGLRVLKIINEPTAAALAYGLADTKEDQQVLIYDLGGGTFDTTLLSITENKELNLPLFGIHIAAAEKSEKKIIRVIANAGNTHLGGDDLDENAVRAAIKVAEDNLRGESKLHAGDSLFNHISKRDFELLKLNIEQDKKAGIDRFIIHQMDYKDYDNKVEKTPITITRSLFETAFEPIMQETLKDIDICINSTLNHRFDKIILVGGSTKLPILREAMAKAFPGTQLFYGLNPDESVALGAAVQSSIINGNDNMQVFDVVPLPIGIDVVQTVGKEDFPGRFEQVIKKDALLPVESQTIVSTFEDDQEEMDIEVYQGTDLIAKNNAHLGTLEIKDIKPGPAGKEVLVSMSVDVNGLLKLRVTCDGNTREAELYNILKADIKLEKNAKGMASGKSSAFDKIIGRIATLKDMLPEEYRDEYQKELRESVLNRKLTPRAIELRNLATKGFLTAAKETTKFKTEEDTADTEE